MKSHFLIALIAMTGPTARSADPANTCSSQVRTIGCFETKAHLRVDKQLSRFIFQVSISPSKDCPQWPPHIPALQGRVTKLESSLELVTDEGQAIGELLFDLWTPTYSGDVNKYRFSRCFLD